MRSYSDSTYARAYISSVKEESSDESTIISSQTSTLTRNLNPEALRLHLHLTPEDFQQGIDSDDDEEEEEEVDVICNPADHDSDQCLNKLCPEHQVEEVLENATDTAVDPTDGKYLIFFQYNQ